MFLVKRAQRGDADAFIELIEQNKQALYKVAKAYLKNEEDIADAIQDTVLSAFEHLGDLQKPMYFKTWLTRILINQCNDILKERRRCSLIEEFPDVADSRNIQSDAEFYDMLECLPEQYRSTFLLYYGQGFGTKEIAQILKISENTVKSRLRRGRANLRSQFIV